MPDVAFVNRRTEERREERAGQGEPLDFDPDDPTVVKVHYDLAAWSFDQRATLTEALADADLPHAWDGDELVVPEIVEARTDALFERLEAEFGPFAIALDDDAESTEFGLDEWSAADRALLAESLIASEVPHRWDGTTVHVAQDAEDAVDDLLDAIEAGELLSATDEAAHEPPDGVLGSVFLAADRLARDAVDARARQTLMELAEQIDAAHPPYAFAPRTWARAVGDVEEIVALVHQDADTAGDEHADRLGERAGALRDLLRPFV